MVRETRHLWVGNLPETVREDRIREHFKRYGRVQSVKIITPPQSSTSSSSSVSSSCTASDIPQENETTTTNFGCTTPNSISPDTGDIGPVYSITNNNNNNASASIPGSTLCLCATVSFMDIKSASKAHHIEHKLDDRILTTEYYEPSSVNVVVVSGGAGGEHDETTTRMSSTKNLIINNNNSSSNNNINGQNVNLTGTSLPQYSSSSSSSASSTSAIINSCNNVPGETISSRRLSTSHGSDDHSSHGFDRNFYLHSKRDARALLSSQLESNSIDNSSAAAATTTTPTTPHQQFHSSIHNRRPIHNNYHNSCNIASSPGSINDVVVVRGRARDRHYTSNRNGSYATCVDRSTPIGHHRISSNNWYESSSSSSSRNLYGSTVGIKSEAVYESPHLERSNSGRSASELLDTPSNNLNSSKSRHHSATSISHHRHSSTSSSQQQQQHTNNNNTSRGGVSSQHHLSSNNKKNKKSRSGSGTPCSTSSRSRSHSRSSCSSTNSESSNESGGSPVPGSGRNIQSAIGSAPICNSSNSSLAGSSAGSSSSHHHLVDDSRSFAIRVRNLPVRSSDTSIKDGLFHEYKKNGKVTWVKVVGQNIDRYAIVCFKKAEDAEKALEDSKDKLFFGCRIDVELYQGYDLQDSDFRAYEAELDEFHPKATRTLFIGNLEKDISASELRKYFDSFGEIIDIDIKKQGLTAYAFCQYSNIVSVVKAMRKMDGEHLGNNRIKLGFGKSMHTNCVWIDGVADSVSENHLISQFGRFGAVEGVTIDRERKLALITFEQNQNAQLAVKEMRGATLRNRKIQIDFASRECQTAFYEKMSNSSCSSINKNNKGVSERASSFDTTVTVPGSRSYNNSSRYENASSTSSTSSSRGRAASFSRPNNPLSGAASPSSTASGGAATRPRPIRYTSTTTDYYSNSNNNDASDVVVPLAHERRFRSYDEYSQGSGASHEDLYEATSTCGSIRGGSLSRDHVESPQSRLGSVISSVGDNSGNSNLHINNSSSCNSSRLANNNDEMSTTAAANTPGNNLVRRRGSDKSSGDIKHLQKERVHLLEQLEECPSSGDELLSPKKRRYGSNYVIDHSTANTNSGHPEYTNSNNVEHNSMPNSENLHVNHHHHFHHSALHHMQHPHRKGVEIRRLSEASLKQHTAASQLHSSSSTNNSNCNNTNNNNRRPSTDSLSRSSSIIDHTFSGSGVTTFNSSLTKRRKTSAVAAANEDHHSSSGRGHRLHSMHSHEASGGESADGSRPGTPLCDEPSEPRRIPRERSHEPMVLPLPKFAEQFFIKLRAMQKEQQKDTFVPAALQPLSTSSISSSSHSGSSTTIGSNNPTTITSSATTTTPTTPIIPIPLALQSSTNIPSVSNTSLTLHSNNTLGSPTAAALFSPNLRTQSSSSSLSGVSSVTTNNTLNPPNSVGHTLTTSEHVIPTSPNNANRPPSLPSSNSSDSETEVRNPLLEESLEERLKSLDEKYEKWSGGSSSHRRSHGDNNGNNGASGAGYRHKLLELDVKEVQPSEIVKTLLAKKSIFDDDSKRLENIGDKYEPREFSNYARTISAVPLVTSASAIPIQTKPATPNPIITSGSSVTPTTSIVPPNLSQIHQQRLVGSNSPMRSPPYTSPSSSSSTSTSTPVIKQLQYPFPSHPPTAGNTSTTTTTVTTTPNASTVATTQSQTMTTVSSVGDNATQPKTPHVQKANTLPELQTTKTNNNSTNPNSRVLTKSSSLPAASISVNAEQSVETSKNDNENVKSYKDRRKASLQEDLGESTESDQEQKQQLLKMQQQQQEAEAKRQEAIEREKAEREKREAERRLAEKREQETQEKLRKERDEAERRAKEERVRQTALAEQRQREEKALLEEKLSTKDAPTNTSNQKEQRSHNHKHNNSANSSPVRGSSNKRRLSSPDAPLANHVDTGSGEVTKKSKSEQQESNNKERRVISSSCKSSQSIEKTPSKYHHKKSDERSSHKDVVSPDEKRHSSDKDTIFDCLRTEKSEKHNKMNRKHSTTSNTSHQVKEEPTNTTKETQRDKENSQTENTMDNKAFFDAIELRSSEEEERLRAIRRETKERKDSHDTNKSTSGNSCDDGSSVSHQNKHESRKNSRSDNHPSSDDTIRKQQQRSKTSRRNTVPETSHSQHQHQHSHTSDETDSDGRKKHSIFDIPDDGPYVSMYDKVKARSCKNMQKQEEEKKIKAKFGKLKRSRAKREGKKRSTSWDEDSDSDDDENPRYRRVNSKGLVSSSDDEMGHHHHHHHRLSDSDTEKMHYHRLHELCEGESSDANTNQQQQKPRRKISSRKNSRTTRMALDSSDDDNNIKSSPIKTELKTEMISDDEEDLKMGLKINTNATVIKQEIKHEDGYSKGATITTPVSAPAMIENRSAFESLFGHESKKKHKKNKKRQKSFPMDSTDEDVLPLSERRETEGEQTATKSDLDKSLEAAHDRRKHSSKKEKKREKTREEHDRKKARKANKLMGKQQSLENKREEKMEDIFGPLSDEESRQSPNSVSPSTSTKPQTQGLSAFDQLRSDSSLRTPKTLDDQSQESQQRKQRKDRKRREKHKSSHGKEDENSVDLDEAGRALEAQLMSDTEIKVEETPKNHEDATDVFRFSDGDDSLDSSKKETSEHRREKKKKKRKSKHHHHNKNHNDEKILSPEPSLPSLIDDVSPNSEHRQKKTGLRDNGMTSPPLVMDKKPQVTSSPLKGGVSMADDSHKQRKQSDIFIPGFGGQIDEKIHESAVLSIAQELETRKSDSIERPESSKTDQVESDRPESPSKAVDGKGEEKSRVVISQEETEDAVAALLGESFGTSNVQDYNEIFEEPVEEPQEVLQEEPVIPEQDDEEMKKAIQSLNADEMDIKADTPQSEHDLQIDTDTEETEEPEKSSQFDNPPKTPDVDFAQLHKNAEKHEIESNKNVVKPVSPLVAKSDDKSTANKKIPVSIPQVKFTPATSITTNANKQFSVLQPPSIKIPEVHQSTPTQQDVVTKTQNALLSPRAICVPTSSKQGPISPRGAVDQGKSMQQGRQMLSPTKGQQSPGQIIFHSASPQASTIGQTVPLNRFPIITQGTSASKPIQTNIVLPQPSQGTLSNTMQKQVHLPTQAPKPENQTIFIHQQQTPRGSIQVVHHQVKVGSAPGPQSFSMFAQNQPTNIPMQRGAHPNVSHSQLKPENPSIFVQHSSSHIPPVSAVAGSAEKLENKPTSSAASSLFDKLKATTDVNPQRLSPVKDEKRSGDEKLEHEPSGTESKEDSDYWSARDVNIDSVIQKLSEEDVGSDTGGGKGEDLPKKEATASGSDVKVEIKVGSSVVVPKVTTEEEPKTEPSDIVQGKVKGKAGRKRKNTITENEAPKSSSTEVPISVTPGQGSGIDDIGGVQTRNSRVTNAKAPNTGTAKRGNGRGARGGKAGQGSKPRNQNSESDVYEFHDDSSDDAPGSALDAAKAVGPVPLALPVVTPPTDQQTTTTIKAQNVTVNPQQQVQQENEKTPQVPPIPSTSPIAAGQDLKEDFLSPGQSAANTRKSRRLLERDGSRSTVDDIIEDVVRNSTTQSPKNSPLRQPSSPAGPGMVIPTTTNVTPSSNPATNRRTTRQNNLPVPEKQSLADVRKSPRGGTTKKNQDRKLSETSVDSSSDEAKLVKVDSIKVEVKSENPMGYSDTVGPIVPKDEKLLIPKQEEITPMKATTPPGVTLEPLPTRMQYKPIPIEKPPTPASSTPSPKPQISSPLIQPSVSTPPVIVNLPPGSILPNSGQKQPIHLPMQHHPQSEIKVVPLPNPPTSQATAVIQHTPISISQPPISQKLPVTASQTTYATTGQKGTHSMHPNAVKHIPIIEQKQGQTVMKICGPPNSGPISQQQPQQLPTNAIITKHGTIQPQIHSSTGNLVINIPPGSVPPSQQQQQQSPRMQTQHMITKHGSVQILQNKQPSQSPGPTTQMIQVGHQSNQIPSPVQQQQQQQQQIQTQMMIHGKPVQIQGPGGYTTVFPGTKIIHQGNQGPPPPAGKQYQVQQIQLTPGQPLPQGTIVTQQPIKMSKSGELQIPTQQIHMPPNKHQQKGPSSAQVPMQQHQLVAPGTKQQGSITIQQTQQTPQSHVSKQMVAPQQQQQQVPPQMQVKGNMIGLHQAPQILTGAVASPPLKHSHVQSQQPIVAGASSSRVLPPSMSPQGRAHTLQAGLPVSAFEPNLGDGNFPPGQLRAVPREYYHHNFMYQQHVQRQQEALAANARLPPHLPRSPMLPGTAEPGISEVEDSIGASPPLELRRPASGPRITAVPLSLQSPGDRATDSPLVYIHSARVPHYPHDPNLSRFYDSQGRQIVEPPPAHRSNAPSSSQYVGSTPPPPSPATLLHIQQSRERDERERVNIVAGNNAANNRAGIVVRPPSQQQQQDSQILVVGHTNIPPHAGLVPAMPELSTRGMQIATPPHGSQVPHQAESLQSLLQRYPVMWQGLLALKNDQAAVQMHFVYGSRDVAEKSLPRNIDGSTPPLRIAQRMRLEPAQIDGVARKMQIENEHCMLLALPCGRDHFDVLHQSKNLSTGFITYLQQKQAAGIVNIAEPGSQQAAYVVHIFPSCEFANESLTRIAPDLLHRVQDIAHLLIVIATV